MANPRKVLQALGLFLDRKVADFRYQDCIKLKSIKVIGPQQPAISGSTDTERIDAIIASMEAHGLVAKGAIQTIIIPETETVTVVEEEEAPVVTLGKASSESDSKPLIVKEKKKTYKRRLKK